MAKINKLPVKYQNLVRRIHKGKTIRHQRIIDLHRYVSDDFYGNSKLGREGLKWKKPTFKINGKKPAGVLQITDNISDGIINWKGRDKITGEKVHIVANLSYRNAGTRAGIHVHEESGITFVVKGKGSITDYVESMPNSSNKKGDYYFMPSNVPMSAANLTDKDVMLLDIFVVRPGSPEITIIEPGYPGYENTII